MDKKPNPYAGHRYPTEIISHAVWLYFQFTLSFRDVEDILAYRGVIVTYEAIRQWTLKVGQGDANTLRRRQPKRGDKWHLDEVVLTMNGKHHYLWRALDQDGSWRFLGAWLWFAPDADGHGISPGMAGGVAGMAGVLPVRTGLVGGRVAIGRLTGPSDWLAVLLLRGLGVGFLRGWRSVLGWRSRRFPRLLSGFDGLELPGGQGSAAFVDRLRGTAREVDALGVAREGVQVGEPLGVFGEQPLQDRLVGVPAERSEEIVTDTDLERAQRARIFGKSGGEARPEGGLEPFQADNVGDFGHGGPKMYHIREHGGSGAMALVARFSGQAGCGEPLVRAVGAVPGQAEQGRLQAGVVERSGRCAKDGRRGRREPCPADGPGFSSRRRGRSPGVRERALQRASLRGLHRGVRDPHGRCQQEKSVHPWMDVRKDPHVH